MARTAGKRTRRETARILRKVIASIESGELTAPVWFVERLRGAAMALEQDR